MLKNTVYKSKKPTFAPVEHLLRRAFVDPNGGLLLPETCREELWDLEYFLRGCQGDASPTSWTHPLSLLCQTKNTINYLVRHESVPGPTGLHRKPPKRPRRPSRRDPGRLL